MLTLADRLRREGRLEGRLEGEIQGKLEVARKLMKNGISIDVVTNWTGLPKEQIENFAYQND